MKLKHWLMFSVASLVIVGCASTSSPNQATASSPIPPSPSTEQLAPAETTAPSPVAVKPTTLRSGSFLSGEHPTQGTTRLVKQNGMTVLELDQGFKTSDRGPDLVVILHRSGDVLGSTKPPAYALKKGDYILLAPLQKFSGAQRYMIPANVNLAEYQSVAIWCRKFNATFGAAKLISQ